MTREYEKREFRQLGVWNVAETKLKVYGINRKGEAEIESELQHLAKRYTVNTMPTIERAEGSSERLGFVIIHRGLMASWLLIQWWTHGDVVSQTIATASLDQSDFSSTDHRPIHGCVWEGFVFTHEYKAWRYWMMRKQPQAKDYLLDFLKDGNY